MRTSPSGPTWGAWASMAWGSRTDVSGMRGLRKWADERDGPFLEALLKRRPGTPVPNGAFPRSDARPNARSPFEAPHPFHTGSRCMYQDQIRAILAEHGRLL